MKCCLRPSTDFRGDYFLKMAKLKNRVGEKNLSYQGYEMEIIKYNGTLNMDIRFNDERGTIKRSVAYKEFKNGCIKNPFHKEVLGIGYIGEGEFTARINGKMSKCYNNWFAMLNRCYGEKTTIPYSRVNVHPDWHNYQNFAKWFYANYNYETMKDWDLDKDLFSNTNKIYSKDTCVFLPKEVNSLLVPNNLSLISKLRGAQPKDGKFQSCIQKYNKKVYLGYFDTAQEAHEVYIKAKKEYLIEVSEKWRGILSDRVCEAIRNYNLSLL